MRRSNAKGFTLVEIVIVIVIVAIIAGIAVKIILEGAAIYSAEDQRSNVYYQAKLAVERMSRESLHIRSCADIVGPANPSNTLSFTDIYGNAVVFNVAANTLSRGGDLLATGVTSTRPFRFLDQSGNASTTCTAPNNIWFVEMDITSARGSETLEVRTRVHPMNF